MAGERMGLDFVTENSASAGVASGRRGDAPGAHVQVRDVTHAYRRADAPAIAGVSFEAEPGEIVALIGRSGAGKSTLLHLIAGLTRAAQGEICIDGATVRAPSPRWVMMFQAPSLFPWMTVAQNVALGLRFSGRRAEAARRVPEVLDLVELTGLADRNAQDLSGGQQQRVALARSLAPEPELLLLDEPFSALDAFTRAALQRDVRAIARRLGLTMILVTHDVGEAVLMADRALVMSPNPGRVAADARIDIKEAERDADAPAFAREAAKLTTLYAQVAGVAGAPAPRDLDRDTE